LCHFARLPSVMVGDRAGIRISIGMGLPLGTCLIDGVSLVGWPHAHR
jgi:hypothetical protein